MAALTVDAIDVPVLESTWKEQPLVAGSRGITETNQIRSVRSGESRSVFTGQSFFALRADADTIRDLLLTYGDHEVDGWLPGRACFCESDVGPIEAVAHRPRGADPAAMWRLSWTLIETTPDSGGS